MQKIIIILILMSYSSLIHAQKHTELAVQTFSISELKEDFLVWRNTLEKTHANLYLYVSKNELDKTLDSFYTNINTPMTALQFYSYISPLVSVIKDGHNYIHPDKKMTEYYNKTALFFPFHISYLDKKMLVDMNLTNDSTIKVGTEILSINGMDADTIMSELLKRMPRDGYNETYPLWILNEWFREYYSYVFGHPTVFRITIKTNDGVFEKQVNALSKDSILNTRKKLYPERLMLNENKKAITYKNMDSLKTGILKIYTFSGKMKKEYNQNFKKTIKSIFEEIKNNKTENLILDLRNNQGGGSAYGTYLLSYLLDKPFSYVRDYFAVRKVQNSSENRLKRKLYNRTRKTNPNKNIFSGNLFLLINGGSFSNSGIVSSCIETHKRAIIIGDEAAGNKTILTSMFTIKPYTILPNTKTVCDKPDYRTIIRDIKLNDGHGVLPNYRIIPTIKDIIYNKDAVLDFTFGLIREK